MKCLVLALKNEKEEVLNRLINQLEYVGFEVVVNNTWEESPDGLLTAIPNREVYDFVFNSVQFISPYSPGYSLYDITAEFVHFLKLTFGESYILTKDQIDRMCLEKIEKGEWKNENSETIA